MYKKKEKKKKGPVEPEKEEEDKLELFFSKIYEFHNPVPVTNSPFFVLAALPPRLAINFVPAAPAAPAVPVIVSSPVSPISAVNAFPASATDYSVISSANFVPGSAFTSCIGPTLALQRKVFEMQ